MSADNNVVILLTGCVNPSGMINTSLTDATTRRSQYVNAIRYYLENTSLKVVFCENTNTDLSSEFADYVSQGRLECLCFDGNNYPRHLGKGYGEALIMLHAIKNSSMLASARYAIKITGRVIVPDVERLARSIWLRRDNVVRFNLPQPGFFRTIVFVFPPAEFGRLLEGCHTSINESATPQVCFEHAIANMVNSSNTLQLIPFGRSPKLRGVSGTSAGAYHEKTDIDNLIDNLVTLRQIKAASRSHIQAAALSILLMPLQLFKKLKGK